MVLQTLFNLVIAVLFFPCLFRPISSLDFIFNSFTPSSLLLSGNATIDDSVLTLNSSEFNTSTAFYPQPVPTMPPDSSHTLPFSTSFIFYISPYHFDSLQRGFVFLFAPPFPHINGSSSYEHLDLLASTTSNLSCPLFAIKFDYNFFQKASISIIINSVTLRTAEAGYWADDGAYFQRLELLGGSYYQVWIDYMGSQINVTIGSASDRRPNRPLITAPINLSEVLLDQMYVGFSATNEFTGSQKILFWSFSNSNFSIADAITENFRSSNWLYFPNSEDTAIHNSQANIHNSRGFIVGVSVGGLLVIMCGYVAYALLIKRRRDRKKLEQVEDWETEYWPHRIECQDIHNATNGFAEQNVIGNGANGKVYRGLLREGTAVAIKHIPLESAHGMRGFLAEISTLGRLKHRNLVGLRGWCKSQKIGLMLVYDYMDSGSLDKWLFSSEENMFLDWQQRIKILKDVASGIHYLHEGWEARVLHRDIKASNVLLDKDMNARLGDFGLARLHHNGQLGETTRVVGTVGYMAPELVHSSNASAQTDVYSFGILTLEMVCGRRPIEAGKQNLAAWVNELMQKGKLTEALDKSLNRNGAHIEDCEVEKVLSLGLLCASPEPNARPSMRLVLQALEKKLTPETDSSHNVVSTGMWSGYLQNFATDKDIENALLYSCGSLSTSDIIVEGR